MNLRKREKSRTSLNDTGWRAQRTSSLFPVAGEVFLLTLPFIEPVGNTAFVGGQLQRSKKVLAIRGLNRNHNHDLKNIFKGAATRAASTAGPFQDFYQACVSRGMKPHLARLTLARKIAAITLLVWKKGVRFDAEHLKQQAA